MRNGFGRYHKMCPGLVVMLRPSKFRVSINEEFSIDTLSLREYSFNIGGRGMGLKDKGNDNIIHGLL